MENARDNENFSGYVRNVVKNIEETQSLNKEIWIPCFKKIISLQRIPGISCIKTVIFLINYVFLKFILFEQAIESFEFSINYENRLGGLLKTRKTDEDYHLIRPPFVLGLFKNLLEV